MQITFTAREAWKILMECLKMISCTMGCIETIVVYEYMKLCMHVDETGVISETLYARGCNLIAGYKRLF